MRAKRILKSTINRSSYLFLVLIISQCIGKDESGPCKSCANAMIDKNNIAYGPSEDFNCNCHWILATTSIDTDDNTAVVLLLQNVSIPMTSGTSGSEIDCSARIRFPGSNEYICNFPTKYCLTFATESSICSIDKIKDKLSNFVYKCDSITPWSEAGGSPYKILYNAGNFAGYTKYFLVQYIEIDCRDQTTTSEATINLSPSTEPTNQQEFENTTNYVASSFIIHKVSTSSNEDISSNHSATTRNKTQNGSSASKSFMNSTMIIIIAASGAGLLLVILFTVLLAARFCKTKNTSKEYSKKNEERTSPNQEHEMIENTVYGETINDHKSETIINEIYDTTPVEVVSNDETCLYAVLEENTGDNKRDGDKNVKDEENIVIIEHEPSSVYAVVNKGKK